MTEIDGMKKVAIMAARQAGQNQLILSKQKINIKFKSRQDIQTKADITSEKIITNLIKKFFPDHIILAEEKGLYGTKKSDFLWIIDPLDGTMNYERGIEEYCVSIAIEFRGEIIFGLIYQPASKKIYIAEKNKGSFLNGKKIHVSTHREMFDMILTTDNSAKIKKRIFNFKKLYQLCPHVRNVRVMGSTALNLARLAEGKIDLYFKSGCNYWDNAAGILLVREAGGKVTNFKSKEIIGVTDTIAVSNGLLHKDFLKLLN